MHTFHVVDGVEDIPKRIAHLEGEIASLKVCAPHMQCNLKKFKKMKSWTVWTVSGPGPDQYRRSQAVPVPVPDISSGTGLSGLWSGKNGLGPDQTELPQHYALEAQHSSHLNGSKGLPGSSSIVMVFFPEMSIWPSIHPA